MMNDFDRPVTDAADQLASGLMITLALVFVFLSGGLFGFLVGRFA